MMRRLFAAITATTAVLWIGFDITDPRWLIITVPPLIAWGVLEWRHERAVIAAENQAAAWAARRRQQQRLAHPVYRSRL